MSKRTVRKVRHTQSSPTFKELSLAGQSGDANSLWREKGFNPDNWGAAEPFMKMEKFKRLTPPQAVESSSHNDRVHSENCHHDESEVADALDDATGNA